MVYNQQIKKLLTDRDGMQVAHAKTVNFMVAMRCVLLKLSTHQSG